MKALRYTKANLEKIAEARGVDLQVIVDECNKASELNLTIYSVIDFVAFSDGAPIKGAIFVTERLLKKHYEFILREDPANYTEMRIKRG